MQLKERIEFNYKKVEEMLKQENKFITDLFSIVAFPERYDENSDEEDDDTGPSKQPQLQGDRTSRATSMVELQKRLEEIQSKRKLTYKEKLQKKGLKNRMKKKTKQGERNAQQKLLKVHSQLQAKPEEAAKLAKPVYNADGKMVFSKFDFSGMGKTKKAKQEKDPKKILQNLQAQKEKLERLEAQGEKEKAVEIKEKIAWKNVLAKAEGQKVKDDPELLKKSVAKQEQKQRSSKKKWDKRIETVKKAQDDRQKKRTENIEKRKKSKKVHKMKTAAKKGKIIPGF